jgi:SNF2 family DNA or RNA helicase
VLVLHGTWQGESGSLALWGEGGETRRGEGRGKRSKTRWHPFAAEGGPLRAAWRELGGGSDGDPAAQARLLLPSTESRPLPSAERARATGETRTVADRPAQLEEWTVPALAAPAEAAMRWLAGLAREAHPAPHLHLGTDLRFWSEAARLALELLARQRFVPSLVEGNDGFAARWEPLWDDPKDARRLAQLAEHMPPACRSSAGVNGPRPARAVLEDFFRRCIDQSIRAWSDFSAAAPVRDEDEAERWVGALATPQARVAGGRPLLRRLARGVDAWTAQLRARGDGFRTCFQLEPPEESGARSAEEGRWRLSFSLQSLEDPSLRVAAGELWELGEKSLRLLNRRFEHPQERLLEDLGRARRIFPPLEAGLRVARPAALALDLDGAYRFLREATPLLEESGYGVLVPGWWERPASRLSLRLRVRPAKRASRAAAAAAGLGLESLVRFDWQAALGGEPLTREEFMRLAALKTPLVKVRGQWVELRAEDLEAALRALEAAPAGEERTLGEALQAQAEAVAAGVAVEAVETEGWIQALLEGGGRRLAAVAPPATFQGELRPYQQQGYAWLIFLRQLGLGACLADDMGLGKTIQLLATVENQRAGQSGQGPALLICPTSVAENWRREAARFTPGLRVLLHHGPGRARGADFAEQAKQHDLVVTTYSLVPRDQETLGQVEWQAVVLDEAQNIKNPETRQTRGVRALRAGWRAALTGTPVENRLRELWSIMEFLNPKYLGPEATFHRRFAIPIERYGDEDRAATLRRLVRPFLLRRVKTDPAVIRDLPEKVEQKVFCSLTREQATLYEAVVREMLDQLEEAEGMERRGQVLATLLRLKQVCNHPAHFLADGSALPRRSGKLNRLEELLEEALSEGDAALVFTQFAEMGRHLERHLRERFGCDTLFLHGGVPRGKRDALVTRFQESQGPAVMVLSLKAGGVGLNLTRASRVFHFDRWWNPAAENQATDRAFRIGQQRNVFVYKFVCTGTVEERIDALIESKTALAGSIVGRGEGWITELSTAELRELFTLRREAVEEE